MSDVHDEQLAEWEQLDVAGAYNIVVPQLIAALREERERKEYYKFHFENESEDADSLLKELDSARARIAGLEAEIERLEQRGVNSAIDMVGRGPLGID